MYVPYTMLPLGHFVMPWTLTHTHLHTFWFRTLRRLDRLEGFAIGWALEMFHLKLLYSQVDGSCCYVLAYIVRVRVLLVLPYLKYVTHGSVPTVIFSERC